MNTNHFILLLMWILYGIIHSLLAANSIKKFFLPALNENVYRIVYNIIAIILLGALVVFQLSIEEKRLNLPEMPRLISGIIMSISGAFIMIVCIKKYFAQLSGISANPNQHKLNPVLETHGLHAYVRHPLYLGTFIFLAGLFFLFPFVSNLIAVVVIIIYTLTGIHFEEKKLINMFGDRYTDYKKRVPMIIPFVR